MRAGVSIVILVAFCAASASADVPGDFGQPFVQEWAPVTSLSPLGPIDVHAEAIGEPARPPKHVLRLSSAQSNSAALALLTLATLGVWSAGRQTRSAFLLAPPEWYHTQGPARVAHATAIDLSFSLAAMPSCAFAAPTSSPGPVRAAVERPRAIGPRLVLLAVVGPRSPPRPANA